MARSGKSTLLLTKNENAFPTPEPSRALERESYLRLMPYMLSGFMHGQHAFRPTTAFIFDPARRLFQSSAHATQVLESAYYSASFPREPPRQA